MIDPAYCRMMASYSEWQNQSLMAAANTLTDEERRLDRGAYFGSIFGTMNHLLWGDTKWLSRLAGTDKPNFAGIPDSPGETPDWQTYCQRRAPKNTDFIAWPDALSQERLDGELRWYSGLARADVGRPCAKMAVHVFNHQPHHSGQIHAMFTAAGASPEDTDLLLIADE